MIQLAREYLWIYTGFGTPPPDVVELVHTGSQAKGATRFAGVAWSLVSAAGIAGGCIALAPALAPELVMPCASVRMLYLFVLLAGSPLLAFARLGLEMAKATNCGVSAARLSVAASSAAWWGLTALVWFLPAYFVTPR